LTRRGRPLASRALIPLAALLALNAAVFLAFTLPRTLAERSLAQRLETLQEQLQHERERAAARQARHELLAANARDTQRFFAQTLQPARVELVPLLSELERLASQAGLMLGDQRFSPERLEAGPLLKMEIAVPVRGDYAALGELLAALEGTSHLLVVDRIELRGDEAGERDLTLALSAYFSTEDQLAGQEESGAR